MNGSFRGICMCVGKGIKPIGKGVQELYMQFLSDIICKIRR
jgi:hypothetical protein